MGRVRFGPVCYKKIRERKLVCALRKTGNVCSPGLYSYHIWLVRNCRSEDKRLRIGCDPGIISPWSLADTFAIETEHAKVEQASYHTGKMGLYARKPQCERIHPRVIVSVPGLLAGIEDGCLTVLQRSFDLKFGFVVQRKSALLPNLFVGDEIIRCHAQQMLASDEPGVRAAMMTTLGALQAASDSGQVETSVRLWRPPDPNTTVADTDTDDDTEFVGVSTSTAVASCAAAAAAAEMDEGDMLMDTSTDSLPPTTVSSAAQDTQQPVAMALQRHGMEDAHGLTKQRRKAANEGRVLWSAATLTAKTQ